jgi:hypothetical protein
MSAVEIFDTNSFTCIGSINMPPYLLKMVHNEKMVFSDLKESLFLYKINYSKNLIDNRYLCKMKKLNPHLYSNPYLLPCGNSICLDCIYDSFNVHCRKFCCNFESCKEEHILSNYELKEDIELKKTMLENTDNLMRSFIDCINSLSSNDTGMEIKLIFLL